MEEHSLFQVSEVDKISFDEEEQKILNFWKKINAFETSLKLNKDKEKFTFYDGPPFATGLMHYGHILAGTIKDVVTRWAHQTGHDVGRRFGWDTHGLPVEYEIDKTHGIKGPEDVEKMGIKKYNELCRGIVSRYAKEWEQTVTRLGRWIDFENDYKTLYPWFMESIWWVFSELYKKNKVYRGVKVMPFSTACSTPLSNFEAGQNYKDIQDPSVVVTFPMLNEPETKFVAWTTTPWTLPSNIALCVNPDADYVKVEGKARECSGVFILMEARLSQIFKSESDYKVISKLKGKDLEGLEYVPLFDYFIHMRSRGAFKVLVDSYVTSESGTGIVHQAPYFGEDDFRISLSYGIITKEMEPICPVDDVGRFTDKVTHFKGIHVKDADPEIIKHLKGKGRLVQADRINHSYPFCWRSDTPLIYRAVPSWFICVEELQKKLLENNKKTTWVPNSVKEKRFANWLRDARDWAISRNRYWGTPIPLWVSDDFQEIVCIGSIEELERLSGEKVTDLHRDNIDHITIPSSRKGAVPLRRISEVFDCWFESGCMPYAQVHYPFENKSQFEKNFPADFIAEGIDQTRGWFYTLLVVATALPQFEKAPFKNVIVNGLILASDGQKMSKRKKNYPDPLGVVEKYGADALRLYLINSPAVRGENLRFKEDDVLALLKEVFIPWLNAYRFFVQQVFRYEIEEKKRFTYQEKSLGVSNNVMDRWIISFTQSLLTFVHQEMKAFRLYTVTPRLIKFVDNLTNWYVRFNRKRLKGENLESASQKNDCVRALETLYSVLMGMVRIMAPFTPFITEMMYQNLKKVWDVETSGKGIELESVHYQMVPEPKPNLICAKIEASVSTLQSVVELGRYLRDKVNCPLKYPLPEIVVIHKEREILDDVLLLENYIKDELNVRTVKVTNDKKKYGVALKAEINFKLLGSRLKGDIKAVQEKIASLNDEEIENFMKGGFMEINGHRIEASEITVKYRFSSDVTSSVTSQYEAHSDSSVLILLDTTPSEEMLDEGLARVLTNRVQKLRKKAKLVPTDEATIWYKITPEDCQLAKVAIKYAEYIENATKTPFKSLQKTQQKFIAEEKSTYNNATIFMALSKDSCSSTVSSSETTNGPCCPWINITCLDSPRNGLSTRRAAVLLENPVGCPTTKTVSNILESSKSLFGVTLLKFVFYNGKKIDNDVDVRSFVGKSLFVSSKNEISSEKFEISNDIQVRYVNLVRGAEISTMFIENPENGFVPTTSYFINFIKIIFKIDSNEPLELCENQKMTKVVNLNGISSLLNLHASTLYLRS